MTKELEALKELRYYQNTWKDKECFDIIETALKRLKDLEKWFLDDEDYKKYKALKIIKEKEVNIHNFKAYLINQGWTYEQYLDEENEINTSGHQFAYNKLTQEEFDLLKEVLL